MKEIKLQPLYLFTLAFLSLLSYGTSEKITLYEHSNREGRWISYTVTNTACNNLPDDWDNRVSSINTHHNCYVVWEYPRCQGRSERIAPGTPHHNYLEGLGFDNQISSFQLCSGSGTGSPSVTERPPASDSGGHRPRPPPSSDSGGQRPRPPPSSDSGGHRPRPPPPATGADPHPPPPASDLSGVRQVLLDEHNILRRRHQAPDIRGNNEEIHNAAQSHADYLASTDRFEQSANTYYGENLAGTQGRNQEEAVRNAVRLWYRGESKYDYNHPGYSSGTGAFTQLVWKSTTHVGIGVAWNPRKNWWVVVANYNPAGNYHGQFRENVLPPFQKEVVPAAA